MTIAVFLLICILALLYLAPSIVAALLKNPQTGAIMVLNMLLGWTLLGWVFALVWAFIVPTERNRPT